MQINWQLFWAALSLFLGIVFAPFTQSPWVKHPINIGKQEAALYTPVQATQTGLLWLYKHPENAQTLPQNLAQQGLTVLSIHQGHPDLEKALYTLRQTPGIQSVYLLSEERPETAQQLAKTDGGFAGVGWVSSDSKGPLTGQHEQAFTPLFDQHFSFDPWLQNHLLEWTQTPANLWLTSSASFDALYLWGWALLWLYFCPKKTGYTLLFMHLLPASALFILGSLHLMPSHLAAYGTVFLGLLYFFQTYLHQIPGRLIYLTLAIAALQSGLLFIQAQAAWKALATPLLILWQSPHIAIVSLSTLLSTASEQLEWQAWSWIIPLVELWQPALLTKLWPTPALKRFFKALLWGIVTGFLFPKLWIATLFGMGYLIGEHKKSAPETT